MALHLFLHCILCQRKRIGIFGLFFSRGFSLVMSPLAWYVRVIKWWCIKLLYHQPSWHPLCKWHRKGFIIKFATKTYRAKIYEGLYSQRGFELYFAKAVNLYYTYFHRKFQWHLRDIGFVIFMLFHFTFMTWILKNILF